MEKFMLVDNVVSKPEVIEAMSHEDAYLKAQDEYGGDVIALNVDDAMTLAEHLIKFVADYRKDVKMYPPGVSNKFYTEAVLDDLRVNLTR